MLMGRKCRYALRPKMNIDGKFLGLGSVIVTYLVLHVQYMNASERFFSDACDKFELSDRFL